MCGSATHSLPQTQEEVDKVFQEVMRRLCDPNQEGAVTNQRIFQELNDLLAGLGHGNLCKAPREIYLHLLKLYRIHFETKPLTGQSRRRSSIRHWSPSHPFEKLDLATSLSNTGRFIPGVGTVQWHNRPMPHVIGEEESPPDLDMYLDASGSMPNPETYSFAVHAALVAADCAIQQGAYVRLTVFSGQGQTKQQDWTTKFTEILDTAMYTFHGGTHFPCDTLEAKTIHTPRLILAVTDAEIQNIHELCGGIQRVRGQHPKNKACIYLINEGDPEERQMLERAGATVYRDTGPGIFKHILGVARAAYKPPNEGRSRFVKGVI